MLARYHLIPPVVATKLNLAQLHWAIVEGVALLCIQNVRDSVGSTNVPSHAKRRPQLITVDLPVLLKFKIKQRTFVGTALRLPKSTAAAKCCLQQPSSTTGTFVQNAGVLLSRCPNIGLLVQR